MIPNSEDKEPALQPRDPTGLLTPELLDKLHIGEQLNEDQRQMIKDRLMEFQNIFAWSKDQLGITSAGIATINTGTATGKVMPQYRINPLMA